MGMNKTNLSKQQTNQAIADLASQFNDVVIPKINWGASAIPAEGFAIWNDFGIALNNRDRVVFENTTGFEYFISQSTTLLKCDVT